MMKNFFLHTKKLSIWFLSDAALLLLFLFARQDRSVMNALTQNFTDPLRRTLGRLCERVPFSVAEALYVFAALALVGYLAFGIRTLLRSRHKAAALSTLLLGLIDAVLTVYLFFCLLWGANYYADGFCERSGLAAEPVAAEALYQVTEQFAALVNEYASGVPRDESGTVSVDRSEILSYAPNIYQTLYEEFPFLAMDDVVPKAMFFSRVMSAMGFTGFYFPLTGESNVNIDFPAATLPTTVAHELAHRRGIASEQECNFLAVLASLRCDNALYRYAGALSGYIYLSNALYSVDVERYRAVRATLNEYVLADLRTSSTYWARFEGPVDTITTAVYDGFLKSYGTIGVKSYGACVDLLVAYFRE